MEGLIFDIQRFSIHDGPGIRSTIFMKGCPLACQWCHNPESLNFFRELMFFENKCNLCGKCVLICPNNVHKIVNQERKVYFDNCTLCGKCVENCSYGALKIVGQYTSVNEVIREIVKDIQYYITTNGGVTISGGEPAMQSDFVLELCKKIKLKKINIAIDTSGYSNWENYEKFISYIDLILIDLKHMDPNIHKTLTGVSNIKILENFKYFIKSGKKINVRFPLIPGKNDQIRNLLELSEFLLENNIYSLEIIPYHDFGITKYIQLGRMYPLKEAIVPSKKYIDRKIKIFKKLGIESNIK